MFINKAQFTAIHSKFTFVTTYFSRHIGSEVVCVNAIFVHGGRVMIGLLKTMQIYPVYVSLGSYKKGVYVGIPR
jgi:hypothetical protein